MFPYEFGVVAVSGEIVQHLHPIECERRYVLPYPRGMARFYQAVGTARPVEIGNGFSHQPVVSRYVKRNKRLYAGVAGVLELFVIGAIDICFERAQACGAPGGVPYFSGGGVRRLEIALLPKRVPRENSVKVFNVKRLVGGFYVEAHISPGAPPKRRKFKWAAIRQEDVGRHRRAKMPSFHGISVSL